MRTFIAIELAPEVKEALEKLQGRLKASGADVKWVEPQNIHLTLKFLGEIDDRQAQAVIATMAEAAGQTRPFRIEIASTGAFPRAQAPRVIWAGITHGAQEAGALAGILDEKTVALGIPKEERAFSAHITLGRTRSDKGRQHLVQILTDLKDHFAGEPLSMQASSITLFKSTLTPRGPAYEALTQTNLTTT